MLVEKSVAPVPLGLGDGIGGTRIAHIRCAWRRANRLECLVFPRFQLFYDVSAHTNACRQKFIINGMTDLIHV